MIVVWRNRALLPKYCFLVTVCLHRFLDNQQFIIIIIIIIMAVRNMFYC
jgi:hypothetical protein